MAAPAAQPPKPEDFPKALRKHLKPILEYLQATHLDDIVIELRPTTDLNSTSKVEVIRADTGVLLKIVLMTAACAA